MESRKEQREIRRKEKEQREENKKLFLKRNDVIKEEKPKKEKKVKEPKEKKVKEPKEKKPFVDTKSKKIIRIIASALLLVATVILIITFVRGVKLNNDLNLIPANYMKILYFVFGGGLAVLVGMLALTIWKKFSSIVKIIFAVIAAAIVALCVYVNSILGESTDLLKEIDSEVVETKAYALVVLKDGEYKKLEDLSYKLLMYYDNEMGETEEAMAKLKEAIVMMSEKTDDIHELANKLMDKSVDAILLEEAYYDIIEEEIPDFSEKITTLYEFNLEDKMPEIVKDVAVTEKPFNIYISGIDSRSSTMPSKSRSDVNMVVSVNPTTKQVLLVNIPRDYYVKLNGTSGYRDKLTHAGIYGVEKSIKTIEDLLNIDINYYVRVNFNSVVKIVDAIGGVEVDSEYAFTTRIGGYKIKKGLNKLNGKKTLAFARERYSLPGGDATRGKNQQAVIDAIIQKVTSTTILTKFDDILASVKGSFQTNMSTDKMVELVRMQITDNAKWTVSSTALNGAGSSERTYSMGKRLLYVMIPYAGNIKQATVLINKVLDGEILDGGSISLSKYNDKLVVPRGVYEDEKKEEEKEETPVTPETPTTPETPGTTPETPGTNPENPGTTPETPGTNPENPGTTPETPGTNPENPGTTPEPTPEPDPEPDPEPEPEPEPEPTPEPKPEPKPEPTPEPEPTPTPTPTPEPENNGGDGTEE